MSSAYYRYLREAGFLDVGTYLGGEDLMFCEHIDHVAYVKLWLALGCADLVSIQSKIDDKLSRCFGPLSGIMERMAGRLDAHALAFEGGPAVRPVSFMVGEAGGSGAAARKGQPTPSADGKAGAPSSTNQTGATAQTNAKNTEEVGKSRLTWQNMPGKTNNAKKKACLARGSAINS